MSLSKKDGKLVRLVEVAQMYYIENKKQSEIAIKFGVSRVFVSKMLNEARELGLIEIIIHDPFTVSNSLGTQLYRKYSIVGGGFAKDGQNDVETNMNLAKAALDVCFQLKTHCLGLGWGNIFGEIISYLEETKEPIHSTISKILPLIGNANIPIRNYQTSENVRILSEKLKATPYIFNLPALPSDYYEKIVLSGTNSFLSMVAEWQQMDTALVNIGNYPSSPDFASGARYGNLLKEKKAKGRLIAYCFNIDGEIIYSKNDFVIQIPLEILQKCKNVIGLCSANTSFEALKGALNTGLFSHIVAREKLLNDILQ